MISQEVFLEAEASYSTGLAGGFFTLKITKKEPEDHSSGPSLHNSSSVMPKKSASFMAVETRQSPRRSMSWMVRRGIPDRSARACCDSPRSSRSAFRFMLLVLSAVLSDSNEAVERQTKCDYANDQS